MNNERIVFLCTETTGLSSQNGNHKIIDIGCIESVSDNFSGSVIQTILEVSGKCSWYYRLNDMSVM